MGHKIYRNLAGKVRVKHTCPHCSEALENELSEAGHKDKCPACNGIFIVPGEAERKKLEEKLKREAADRQLQEETQLEAQKLSEELRLNEQLLAEEEQSSTAGNTDYPALELYISSLRACGWICIIFIGLSVVGQIVLQIVLYFRSEEERSVNIWAGWAFGITTIVLLLIPLGFFVVAQLLQLALDARRDIAKLVNQRKLDREN